MLPFQPAESITPIEGGSHVYFRVETPAGDSLFFTHRFKPLSVQPDDKITVAGGYYIITRGDKTALLDVTDEELLPFATQQFFWMAELSVFMIAINKGKGLYLPGSGWLVEPSPHPHPHPPFHTTAPNPSLLQNNAPPPTAPISASPLRTCPH